jgi:hypothetical protein
MPLPPHLHAWDHRLITESHSLSHQSTNLKLAFQQIKQALADQQDTTTITTTTDPSLQTRLKSLMAEDDAYMVRFRRFQLEWEQLQECVRVYKEGLRCV